MLQRPSLISLSLRLSGQGQRTSCHVSQRLPATPLQAPLFHKLRRFMRLGLPRLVLAFRCLILVLLCLTLALLYPVLSPLLLILPLPLVNCAVDLAVGQA